jgi:hypothetical protein
MSERPRLSTLDVWAAQERACLEVLADALALLVADPGDSDNEDDLNRRLFQFITAASHARNRAIAPPIGAITYEGRNSPAASDAERAARESKRPDFFWAWIDDLDPDPYRSRREYVLECKRLGPRSNSWVFTRNYITEGVLRYVRKAHGYGKGMRSGAMIGYLQKIAFDSALDEVNANAVAHDLPRLEPRSPPGADPAALDHEIDREFGISPFRLRHVWTRVK